MNEDEIFDPDPRTEHSAGRDPLPEEASDAAVAENLEESTGSLPAPLDEGAQAPALPWNPPADPDHDPVEAGEQAAQDGLECLRGELKALREALEARNRPAQILGQSEEFRALYPDVSLASLPRSVLEEAERGVPIAAAYALYERRRYYTAQKAAEYNAENEKRSAGGVSATEPDYFSPAEVRSMSPAEVRSNYQKIMQSMQKWH